MKDKDQLSKRTTEEFQRKTAEIANLNILYRDDKVIIEGLKSDCQVYKETIKLLERQFKDIESRYIQFHDKVCIQVSRHVDLHYIIIKKTNVLAALSTVCSLYFVDCLNAIFFMMRLPRYFVDICM